MQGTTIRKSIACRRPCLLRVTSLAFGFGIALANAQVADGELVAIDFRNRIRGVLDAPVYDFDGVTPLGTHAECGAVLYVSPQSPEQLMPIGSSIVFGHGTDAGYWSHESIPLYCTVPSWLRVAVGERIFYQVRVWERLPLGQFGTPVPVGGSRVYSLVVTNSVMPLVGFQSFNLVEELRVRRHDDQVVIQWDYRGARQYNLEATSTLGPRADWSTVFMRATYGEAYEVISVTNTLSSTPQFYRLWRQR